METICDYDDCMGCSVCHDVCPKEAITIDCSTGFWRPNISREKCVDCGLCRKVCPANNIAGAENYKKNAQACYASWSKNLDVHFHSASGGLAYEISKYFIESGGCVAGCAFEQTDDTLIARHVIVDSLADLKKLSKSKYVHSNKDGIYKAVAEKLKTQKCLFIGVSCEVFGLLQYLKVKSHDTTNLYTINLLCRGGSSPFAMTSHLKRLEKKFKRKITNVTFRGGEYNCQFVAYSGSDIVYRGGQFEDEYFFGFMAHTLYQPVCHKCHFAESRRISDITLADFQGLDKEIEAKCNGKGNSLVLIHNEKGRNLIDGIQARVYLYERSFEEAVSENTTLKEPTETHEEHDSLWRCINKIGFDRAIHKVYWKHYLKLESRKIISKITPKFVKKFARKLLRRG